MHSIQLNNVLPQYVYGVEAFEDIIHIFAIRRHPNLFQMMSSINISRIFQIYLTEIKIFLGMFNETRKKLFHERKTRARKSLDIVPLKARCSVRSHLWSGLSLMSDLNSEIPPRSALQRQESCHDPPGVRNTSCL
jgi:hypothetical protein